MVRPIVLPDTEKQVGFLCVSYYGIIGDADYWISDSYVCDYFIYFQCQPKYIVLLVFCVLILSFSPYALISASLLVSNHFFLSRVFQWLLVCRHFHLLQCGSLNSCTGLWGIPTQFFISSVCGEITSSHVTSPSCDSLLTPSFQSEN